MKKRKLKKKYLKVLTIIMIIISFCLVLYNVYNIFKWYKDSRHIKELTNKLYDVKLVEDNKEIEYNLVNPPEDRKDIYYYYQNVSFLNIDFTKLLQENKDTVGWITVSGTDIDYPIVQTKDNDYYLTHSFDKSENKAGWIFLDYRNNLNMLNNNTIIYGHRRNDGTMFGTLKNVLKDDWLQNINNHIIRVSTPKENYIFEIISVYSIYKESYYITTKFNTTESYQKFLDTIIDRSEYDFKASVNTDDKILTLSSCFDTKGNRMVVHAKLIKKGIRSS